MTPQILPFSIDAYGEVYALWDRCEGVGLSQADSRENIERYLDRNPGMSFLARDAEGRVVGAVLAGHDGRRGYLHHLAVDPSCRRQNLGRQLEEQSIQALKNAGIVRCHLFVFSENAAGRAFWQSIGWRWREDVRMMTKDLDGKENGDESRPAQEGLD